MIGKLMKEGKLTLETGNVVYAKDFKTSDLPE